MKNFRKDFKVQDKICYIVVTLMLIFALYNMVPIPKQDVFATISKDRLVQLPSESSDFPNNDPSLIDFRVLKATKNIITWYLIEGQIINLSNKTLYFPKPIAYLFDKDNEPIGRILDGSVMTTEMKPQTSTSFRIPINPVKILGEPKYYKLGFTGTFSKE